MVQWLRLGASTAWGAGSVLVRELRSHKPRSTARKRKEKNRFMTNLSLILTSRKFSNSIYSNQVTTWFALIDCVCV